MTVALQLLAAGRRDDLLREQRRLGLAALVACCRRAARRLSFRPSTEACAA
ncbi:MAG TPA: hypothetical protein VHQ42_08860 [Candidatus Limnocylindria bacterium]|nr:hypothetical protein [Candidatus Limnocylindria bacterium]